MRAHKPSFIALLAVNLSPDSRIKRKTTGFEASRTEIFLSLIFDNLTSIKHGLLGGDCPQMLTPVLLGQEEQKLDEQKRTTYDTPEAWQEAMKRYEK